MNNHPHKTTDALNNNGALQANQEDSLDHWTNKTGWGIMPFAPKQSTEKINKSAIYSDPNFMLQKMKYLLHSNDPFV